MEITPALLKKYNEGTCTAAEKQAMDTWLDQQEGDVEDDLPAHMMAIGQQIWQEIDPGKERQPAGKTTRFRRGMVWAASAAAVVILAMAGFSLYSGGVTTLPSAEALVWETATTGRGQKQQLTLPDGTQVLLNHASTISYPLHFGNSNRTVRITGEAWLQVAKNAAKPFVVQTPATTITVLGTAFDVQAYEGDAGTTVTVTEGKVAFAGKNQQQQLIVTAGQQGNYRHSGSMQRQNVYAASYLAWKDDQLLLADKTLPEIAAVLQRWYNVEVSITNAALQQEHFTGTFYHASLEEVLKQITFVIKCHYKIEHEKVTLY